METTIKEELTKVQRTNDNKYNLITEDGNVSTKTETEMKDEKKYRFRDNFSGDSYQFASLNEAKKAAKNHTFGFPIYIYERSEIAAIVNPNDKPLP